MVVVRGTTTFLVVFLELIDANAGTLGEALPLRGTWLVWMLSCPPSPRRRRHQGKFY